MSFIEQLRAEVLLHGDMENDFRTKRYTQAQHIARKYIDTIEEQARIAARSGQYELLEERALISGFVQIHANDFELPLTAEERHKHFMRSKSLSVALNPENELFTVFLSAFEQLCAAEHITLGAFQAQVSDKEGRLELRSLPLTLKKPKKEKITGYGFPYQIRF